MIIVGNATLTETDLDHLYYAGLRVPQLFPVGFEPVVRLQGDSLVLVQIIVWASTNGQQPCQHYIPK